MEMEEEQLENTNIAEYQNDTNVMDSDGGNGQDSNPEPTNNEKYQ